MAHDMKDVLYDARCYELASAFLEDESLLNTEVKRVALAKLIQLTVEDWIEYEKENAEPPDPMHGVEFPFADNH